MMARTGSGWQYILADLSLILFMVTAAALASAEDVPVPASPVAAMRGEQALSPQAAPLAFYRAAPEAPPLGVWLREQSADARQQLTIVAQYGPGGQAAALDRASALAREAGEAGMQARVVVEPGPGGTTASLAFDATPLAGRANGTMLAGTVPGN